MAQLEGATGSYRLYAITEKILVTIEQKLGSLMENSSLSVLERAKHEAL